MNYSPVTKKRSSLAQWLPLLAVIWLSACNRDKIQVYYAPKENPTPEMAPANGTANNMGGSMPAGHPDLGAQPQLSWKTPEGWTEAPRSEFRLASFNAKSKDGKLIDVSIVPLAGTAGGDLANVNRWRFEQTGLPKITVEELTKIAQPVEVGGQPADLYEQIGKDPSSGDGLTILGVIQHRGDTAWFFKMTGDPEAVAEQKPTFVEFLKTVKFENSAMPEGHPPMSGMNLPSGHPDTSMMPAPTSGPISHEGQPTWQIPTGWQEVSGGQFLIAKFLINDNGAQAAVNVSASAGNGGGLLANVNRWRVQQLGLSAASEGDLQKMATEIDVAGGKELLVDFTGTDFRSGQPARLIGVMVQQPNQAWFYKLMGDPKIVEAQKDAFTKFVQTTKY